MKTFMRRIFHFLGGVHFAICLIGVTAVFVIAGTLIESKTESHRYAAYYTYKHPAFITLLCFFFINILFASLRRWPFKLRHIPFQVTHLGLLMILSGTIIKESSGIQGTMFLLEGSGSHLITINDSDVLRIEKRAPQDSHARVIGYYNLNEKKLPFDGLQVELLGYSPHTEEKVETWFKGNEGVISGLKPFPVHICKNDSDEIPINGKVRLLPEPHGLWNLHALKTSDVRAAVLKTYLQGMKIRIKGLTGKILFEGLLNLAINQEIKWNQGRANIELQLKFSTIHGLEDSLLIGHIQDEGSGKIWDIEVPLTGPESLINRNVTEPQFGIAPYTIDLHRIPSIVLIQDAEEDSYLLAYDYFGRIYCQTYRYDNLKTLVAYDDGFGGYAALAAIPFDPQNGDREAKEKVIAALLTDELKRGSQNPSMLAPPLKMLFDACQKAHLDFAETCLEFLNDWNQCCTWIIPEKHTFKENAELAISHLDWDSIPSSDRKASFWSRQFFEEVDLLVQHGSHARDILTAKKWPLPLPPHIESNQILMSHVTQQLFSIGDLLPESSGPHVSSASAFSSYMRAYGIHLRTITPPLDSIFTTVDGITLETPITLKLTKLPSLLKLEDNTPAVTLKFKKGTREEIVSLAYDRTANGLKWPIFGGDYLIRFQPSQIAIPHHVRLRQARQLNYPNEAQPYSYESDICITDLRDQSSIEKTISMNNIYETKDGFRFYLSSMNPPNETTVKRIQLAVNYDPAKYFLTYPGGVLMSLGIILLFWFTQKNKT
jgi:hypothetical protein